jgi:small subunit ribosomal protein S5
MSKEKKISEGVKASSDKETKESTFVDNVVAVRRVTKVTKGGKRFAFSAFVVTGDKEGRVGIGLGKSREVASAIAKATARARKDLIQVPLRQTTIPYDVKGQHGASKVILRSASKGTGVIAGGAVRAVMDVAGIKDVLAKSIGSANQLNVVKATLNALAKLRSAEHLAKLRGKTVQELVRG